VIVKIYRNTEDLKSKKEIVTTVDSDNGFRITFRIEKHITSDPNAATIEVFNLSRPKIEAISVGGIWVELYAGYGDNTALLYSGAVASVSAQKNGDDTDLILMCRTDWNLDKKIYGGYFEGKTGIVGLVTSILDKCEIPYSREHILISGDTGERGWSFADSAKDILDSLARMYNFSWSIQDYGFFAIDDKTVFPSNSEVKSPLIDAYMIPKEDDRTSAGYDITCILGGSFQVGHNVVFNSMYKKGQDFKIFQILHAGDTHGDVWMTNLKGYKSGSLVTKKKSGLSYFS
jgi:hypothetical protein